MIEALTAILVAVTGFYAYVTRRILKANEAAVSAMRDQSDALTRPYVVVSPYLPPKGAFIYLRIFNAGKTAASNLRLQLNRDFFRFGERDQPDSNLATYNAFNLPIASLPPGAEMLFYLGQGFVIFGEEADEEVTPTTFTVTATYSYGDRTVREENHVDLRPYNQSAFAPDRLVDKLEEIKKVIEKGLRKRE